MKINPEAGLSGAMTCLHWKSERRVAVIHPITRERGLFRNGTSGAKLFPSGAAQSFGAHHFFAFRNILVMA